MNSPIAELIGNIGTPMAGACAAGFAAVMVFGFRTMRKARLVRRHPPATEHLRFWNLLLQHGNQSVAVLAADGTCLCSSGLAAKALVDCRARPDIAQRMDALLREGTAFASNLPGREGKQITVHGMPVGGRAVLYFKQEAPALAGAAQTELRQAAHACRDTIRRLPVAAACFNADRRLWAYSDAFARLWSLPRDYLDAQPQEGQILQRLRDEGKLPEQPDFQGWKQKQIRARGVTGESWHLPDGRSLRINRQGLAENGKLVLFEDISQQLALETAANLLRQVQKATLDTLDEAIAIFAADGRIIMYNAHFAALWHLSEAELAPQPHYLRIAALCLARIGQDEIWNKIGESVNAVETAQRFTPRTLQRADGRRLLLALSRLPNRATIANFTDLTDMDRFKAMQDEDRQAIRNTGS